MEQIAVDAGRYATKVAHNGGIFQFVSKISDASKHHRTNLDGDMEINYEGKEYFVGQLADREGDSSSNMTPTKAHNHTLLEVLVACFQAGLCGDVHVTTAVPINMYSNESEKEKIKNLLKREHEIMVNGTYRKINIKRLSIGLECASSYLINKEMGTVRIVDPGARTINYATFQDGIYIGRDSGTVDKGWEVINGKNPERMTDIIIENIGKRWDTKDKIQIIGGKAHDILEPIKQRGYTFATVPKDPQYATVQGLLLLGRNSKNG